MAELGSVDFRDPNQGNRPASYERVSRGVAQAVQGVITNRQEDILGSFREAQDSTVDAIRSENTLLEQDTIVEGTPDAEKLQARLRKLQRIATSGNSSTQAKAQLELKRELNRLQRLYPSMRGALAEEFSAYVRTDADYMGLQQLDIGAQERAKEAQAIRQDIIDHATKRVSEGGLGIDPALDPNSRLFAMQYTQRRALRSELETNALVQAYRLSDAQSSIAEKSDALQQLILGRSNIINDATEAAMERGTQAIEQGLAGNLDALNQWQSVQKEQDIQSLENQAFALRQELSSIPLAEQQTEEYRLMKGMVDSTIAHLEKGVTALRNNDLSAVRAFETERILRKNAVFQAIPDLNRVDTYLDAASNVLDAVETIGIEDTLLQEDVSKLARTAVHNLIAYDYLKAGDVPTSFDRPTFDPTAGSTLPTTATNLDRAQESFVIAGSRQKFLAKNFDVLKQEPQIVATHLAAHAHDILAQTRLPQISSDQRTQALDILGDDTTLQAALLVREQHPQSVLSLADAGKTMLRNSGATDFLAEQMQGTFRTTPRGRFNLGGRSHSYAEALVLDDSALKEEGIIRLVINPTYRSQHAFSEIDIARIKQVASSMGREATAYLKALANLELMEDPYNGQKVPDYLTTYVESPLFDIYGANTVQDQGD